MKNIITDNHVNTGRPLYYCLVKLVIFTKDKLFKIFRNILMFSKSFSIISLTMYILHMVSANSVNLYNVSQHNDISNPKSYAKLCV